jgi:hypothetical protein
MKHLTIFAVFGSVLLFLPALAQEIQPNTEFHARLLTPLSTEINRKGDKITAQIVTPAAFAGSMMEGEVKDSKSGAKLKGSSVLSFTFKTVHVQDRVMAVESELKSFVNSKGQANVDEEGRVVMKKNNLGKVAVATGLGALIGGIAGGAKGAGIGAGVGGAASLILVQMTVKAPNIAFAAGTQFILNVSPGRGN